MRVRRRYRNLESQPEDQFGSSNSIDHQPQSFGDFAHGTALHRPETKLTCPSPTTTTGARGPRFHAGDEEPYTARDPSFARKLEKHKLCLCFPYYYTHIYTMSHPKGTTSLQSLFVKTTMEPLPHGLLVLSSSKPLTGRTGHKLKDASTTGTTLEISLQPGIQEYSTGQGLVAPQRHAL